MKIGNPASGIHDPASLAPASTARATPEELAKTAAGAAPDSSAKVDLSSTAASLMSGVQGSSAEFDAGKVARVSQAIESGTFTVNAEAIADKLIANAKEVLGGGAR